MSFSVIFPSGPLRKTFSSWKKPPTGITMTPPTASWSRRGSGIRSGAAVTIMPSNGAFSGQPR